MKGPKRPKGAEVSLPKGPKCPKGTEVVGAEVAGAEVVGAEVSIILNMHVGAVFLKIE